MLATQENENPKPIASMVLALVSVVAIIVSMEVGKGESEKNWNAQARNDAKIEKMVKQVSKVRAAEAAPVTTAAAKPKIQAVTTHQSGVAQQRIQLASFSRFQSAKSLLDRLKKTGIDGSIVRKRGGSFWSVVSEKIDTNKIGEVKHHIDHEFKIRSMIVPG